MLKGTMVRPSPICRSYRAWTSLYFNSSSTHLPIGTYSIIHGHRCLVFACILRVLPGIYKFVLDSADTVEYWYGGILLIYQKPPDDRPRQPWILSSEIISQLGNYLENSPQHSSCRRSAWILIASDSRQSLYIFFPALTFSIDTCSSQWLGLPLQ